jgi:hypothetical protein
MNWMNILTISLVVAGGIVAATYEVHARRRGLPVGLYVIANI